MGINQYIKIGSKIKKARISKGIRQKDMAGELGLSISTYSNYENNYREPKLDVVERICDVLDMTIDELMDFPIDDSEYRKDNSSAQNNIIEQNPDNIPRRYSDVIKIKYELTPEKLERIRLDEEAEGIIKKQASGQKITDEERQKVSDYIERREKSYAKLCETVKKLGKIVNESFKPSIESYDSILQAFNNIAASILNSYKKLNDVGQQKVIDYIEDLSNIPEYRKEPPQEEPPSPQTPPDTRPEFPQD